MERAAENDFLAKMDQAFTGRGDPVAQLLAALDNDDLFLYCQPIRALSGGPAFPMAEVLVRMRKEETALLPPGDFLPVFEHYKLMPLLDRWVVRAAASHLARGSRFSCFTINLSGQTLEDADFPDFVAEQFRKSRVKPGALLFEIDEAALLAQPWAAEVCGTALRRIGSGILIDGFGQRTVSFAPLKGLRPSFIKVDGSITRQVLASASAELKMKAVVRVGEALGIGIIAECVEDQTVLMRLKALGTGYAQGFGISRPQPIDAFADADSSALRVTSIM